MAKIVKMSRSRDFDARRAITIELPEFLIQALECRVAEANASADEPGEQVTLEHLVEYELAETVSIAELALLEGRAPGIAAAAWKWLGEID